MKENNSHEVNVMNIGTRSLTEIWCLTKILYVRLILGYVIKNFNEITK